MAGRSFLIIAVLIPFLGLSSCANEGNAPAPARTPAPTVIVKPKPKALTAAHRSEIGFPEEMIAQVESAAGSAAEPFFEHVTQKSSNLKGDVMITTGRLAGFSVRTQTADAVIADLSPLLRPQGYLIFRSRQNFGRVPDVVSVVRGNSSYDILKVQRTESSHYRLDTKAIISWLRKQQRHGSFVITGAGADWVEARFIKPPRDLKSFARKIAAFAPDVLREGPRTVDKLAEQLASSNGFRLVWD